MVVSQLDKQGDQKCTDEHLLEHMLDEWKALLVPSNQSQRKEEQNKVMPRSHPRQHRRS